MLKGKREHKSKFLIIFKSVVKHIKIPYLLLFIVLLSVNTFAWFIYSQKVNTNVDVHVRGWKVMFSSREGTVSNSLHFNVTDMYPGMDDFNDYISIYNDSEVNSRVYFNIIDMNILGETFTTVEGRIKKEETIQDTDMTSAELIQYLEDTYPFTIELSLSDSFMTTDEESSTFSINVSWDYESGDDALDTYWGNTAYNYMKDNDTRNCITMVVDLIVEQVDDSSDSSSSSSSLQSSASSE